LGKLSTDHCINIPQFRIPAYITWKKVIEGYDIDGEPMDILRLIGKLIVPLIEEASLTGVGFLDKGIPKC
jgi:hypothetical protein